MTKRTKQPIESFGPQVFNALVEGSRREYRIPTIYRSAVQFRLRAHRLRERMREELHPLYSIAAKTKLTIEWDETKVETLRNRRNVRYPRHSDAEVVLVIAPHDSQFDAALKAAGLDLKPMNQTPDPEPPSTTSLDKLLKDL